MPRSPPGPYVFPPRVGLQPPSLQPPSPAPPCPEVEVDPERMATQTDEYMNKFAQYAEEIRKHPNEECHHAYRTLLSQGRVLPLGTKWPHLERQGLEVLRHRMEDILQKPAASLVDHLEKCSAAQTLLHLQRDILCRLPFTESERVEKRIDVLRAARRQKFASSLEFCNSRRGRHSKRHQPLAEFV